LAPIIIDEPLAMVTAVVLENKPCLGVIQINPAHEPTCIAKRRLNFGPWQTGLDQNPTKSRLHRRLGWGRQQRKGVQSRSASPTLVLLRVARQDTRVNVTFLECHVDGNQRFYRWPTDTKLG
jgi:hypothetical protein